MIPDTYRGNLPITVKELRDFLAHFADTSEVVFYVDVDPSSSFYHADELTTDKYERAWIHLTDR